MLQKMGVSGRGPSHLVLLFCVSGGKNGEELGSDEEQIVYLVYLLFDVCNNKVLEGLHYGSVRDAECLFVCVFVCRLVFAETDVGGV